VSEAEEEPVKIDSNDATTKRVDHLPVIVQALERLGVRRTIDELCPPDPRNRVTTGQCVEALIARLLDGSHTLYLVDERLGEYDLALTFGWDVEGDAFNDERLAKALDHLYEAGLAQVQAPILMNAVRAYTLDLSRLHFDTTSFKVFGRYATSHATDDEDPQAIPHVTHGYSKDHRADLKQIVYGVTVTGDGAVPIVGRVASGNRNDALENRFNIRRLAQVLPDPRGTILVADSKFFAGETLLLAREHGLRSITMLPRSVGLWDEAFVAFQHARARGESVAILKEEVSEREGGKTDVWCGRSFDLVYHWKDEEKKEHAIPLRALVVESSSSLEERRATLEKARVKEREALEKALRRLEKKEFKCAHDAEAAMKDFVKRKNPRFHKLTETLVAVSRPKKRARRGRPARDERPQFENVWRVKLPLEDDLAAFERACAEAGCFVLVTTPVEGFAPLSDAEIFGNYKAQSTVEGVMHWAKSLHEVAPIFLKTPRRVAALGMVCTLALMVHALIQRDVRARLAAAEETLAGNDNRQTDKPTTEVLFRLFAGIGAVRSGPTVFVTNMTTEQARALELLGNTVLDKPGVEIVTPQAPRPGRRGYRRPRPRGGLRARAARARSSSRRPRGNSRRR
jgi:transposase